MEQVIYTKESDHILDSKSGALSYIKNSITTTHIANCEFSYLVWQKRVNIWL